MKLNAISALIMYQNISLNCRRSYVTDIFFNASLNLFLSPDKSLIVFDKWLQYCNGLRDLVMKPYCYFA